MGGFMQVRLSMNLSTFPSLTVVIQPQGHVQVLLNMLRGFTAQAALDAPRFCISAGLESKEAGRTGQINSEVFFEDSIPEETVAKL
jgi:gamma-glutamyltranspeptidase/glutathione hydrolase